MFGGNIKNNCHRISLKDNKRGKKDEKHFGESVCPIDGGNYVIESGCV